MEGGLGAQGVAGIGGWDATERGEDRGGEIWGLVYYWAWVKYVSDWIDAGHLL